MTTSVYFESTVIVIEHDQELGAVVMNWKPVWLKSELYREALEKGLELVKEKNLQNWIANLKEMKLITLEDEKWTNEVWFPKALKSPIRHMALILSSDVFNKVAVNKIMSEQQVKNITSLNVQSVSEAREWIAEKSRIAA
ncbi:MAG: hypothetical protein JJU28_09885 [Cyclobacteriaceae bacterium]|nr:hypothetical protein [Cyclobacteriaceae bacterium]